MPLIVRVKGCKSYQEAVTALRAGGIRFKGEAPDAYPEEPFFMYWAGKDSDVLVVEQVEQAS